jgi:hypothetical protein
MGDIISGDKLRKLRLEFSKLRRQKANLHWGELCRFAEALGRTKKPGGKHMRYTRDGCLPITIPCHGGGKPLNRYTAESILDALEEDLARLEGQRE